LAVRQDQSAAARWFPAVLDVPLIRFLGAQAIDPDDPAAGLLLDVGETAVNAAEVMHGGTFATLLDLAAYLAVLPVLEPSEQAVTHAFSAAYLGAVVTGSTVRVRGEVLRRTRHLAYTTAQMMEQGGRLVATASVVKSIIPSRS
jgi:uncharacterized protein (TIGR00369 family)